jgi:hypothetical protein
MAIIVNHPQLLFGVAFCFRGQFSMFSCRLSINLYLVNYTGGTICTPYVSACDRSRKAFGALSVDLVH